MDHEHTVLVTGGAGYIGSHACQALRAAGFTPVACDNLVYGHPWAVRSGLRGGLKRVVLRNKPIWSTRLKGPFGEMKPFGRGR